MGNLFEKLLGKWKKEDLAFYLDTSNSKDFFQFKLPTSTRTAHQVEHHHFPKNRISKSNIKKDEKGNLVLEIETFGPSYRKEVTDQFSDYNIPSKKINVGVVELYKSAKLTDFISGDELHGNGWIVSDSVKDILSDFNIGSHQYYPISVLNKDKRHDNYYYLQYANDASDFVDYARSSFYKNKTLINLAETREDIEINSKEEIPPKIKELRKNDKWASIYPKTIILTKTFPAFDLFEFHDVNTIYKFISDRLATKLKESSITGYEVIKTSKIGI